MQGEAAGRAAIARQMKLKGMDIQLIADMTGLKIEEIEGVMTGHAGPGQATPLTGN